MRRPEVLPVPPGQALAKGTSMRDCVVWLVALGVLGAGCANSIGVDDMPAKVAATVCTKVYDCCQAAELPSGSAFAPDEATCETTLKTNLSGKVNGLKAEEDRGRLTYHGDRLAECLARWQGATCETLKSNATSSFPPCDDYVQPRVEAGLNCRLDESCIGGHCSGQSLDADGVCVGFVAEGRSCAAAPCGLGLYCDSSKVCQAVKPEGSACNSNGECASGGCNGRPTDGGSGPGTCGPKGGTGTTCFATTGCTASGAQLSAMSAVLLLLALVWPRRRRSMPPARQS